MGNKSRPGLLVLGGAAFILAYLLGEHFIFLVLGIFFLVMGIYQGRKN
ncbi:MAG: hypothetical protein GX239_01005 [Clostridiaceae bacterium]|nr:hypothetical protein [Clostridiaceae bacterium]